MCFFLIHCLALHLTDIFYKSTFVTHCEMLFSFKEITSKHTQKQNFKVWIRYYICISFSFYSFNLTCLFILMKTVLKLLRRCDFTICRNSSGLKSIFRSFLDCIITGFQNLIQDKFVVDESKMTITDSQFVETLKKIFLQKIFREKEILLIIPINNV